MAEGECDEYVFMTCMKIQTPLFKFINTATYLTMTCYGFARGIEDSGNCELLNFLYFNLLLCPVSKSIQFVFCD